MRLLRRWGLVLAGLVALLAVMSLRQEAGIPLPGGAIARLGLGSITNVMFSPDGKCLAVATSLGVELRDVKSFRLVRTITGHTDWVTSVSFFPDGSLLASASTDGTILLWDIERVLHPN